ncbi:neutral zinc metallopeptidase [Saccharomonospora xinjiangensis]|uniref:neutral zinc metallopeptidase n=1 Tax=Saccharomonospora xinjiangensis TaxID=75294 RepID=UPI00106F12FF|nr:neutral zinc metallopeptidase [Saccharomonospora xinjiangensis]QBQ59148.1 Putative neutral zinc metallopeptidase [Saccharomonospora xinjiangensis]
MLASEFGSTRGDDEMTQPPPWQGPGSHGQGPRPSGHHPSPQQGPAGPAGWPPRKPAWPYALAYGAGSLLLVGVLVLVYVLTTGTGTPTPTHPAAPPPSPLTAVPSSESPTPSPSTSSELPGPRSTPPAGGASAEGQPAEPNQPAKIFKLADHPILQDPDAGLANRACHLPGWQSTPEGAEAFFTAARECLDAAWEPFLRAYNLPFTPPRLHFPSSASFDTQCGRINVGIATAAYYCEGDLYLPYDGLQTQQYGETPGVYLALFAHEYGHHVQEMAGIMDAAWDRIYAEGRDSPAGREMSRRKELQAQCFSGMFLGAHVDQGGSITREMYNAAWYDQETRGDDTSGTHDHGTNANYAKWWRAGAYDNRIVDCNTFAAPNEDVA